MQSRRAQVLGSGAAFVAAWLVAGCVGNAQLLGGEDGLSGQDAGGVDAGGTGGAAVGGGTGGAAGGGAGGSSTGGGTGGATTGGGSGGSATGGGAGGSSTGGGSGGSATGGGTGGSATGGGTGGSPDGGAFTPGPTGCVAQGLEANVSVGGYMSDRYAWSDAHCLRRTAALVRNTASDPGGSKGGYLRQLTYTANGTARTATGTGSNGWNGWGYIVDHYGSGADLSKNKTGTFRTVLAGAHHAIHEFVVQMSPGGPVTATVQWFFATGRSEPVYAIVYDVTAAADVVNADTRAPYGDLAFEGTAGDIAGVGWGDQYRFTTTGAGPVTLASTWDYTVPNVVPYVRMWSAGVDAEMGAVQTQTFAQHVGGGDYGYGTIQDCQGKTSATKGVNCSNTGEVMPKDWLWPFQLNQYELPYVTSSHRLAWGSNYGAVGQTTVTAFGKTFSGYPREAHSVFMVVGTHSGDEVLARATQVERSTAAVVTGAAWAPTFGVWEGAATANVATVTLDPVAGPIDSPVFHVTGFTATQVTAVKVNGVTQDQANVAFVTLDTATQSVWLTLNGTVRGPITVRVE